MSGGSMGVGDKAAKMKMLSIPSVAKPLERKGFEGAELLVEGKESASGNKRMEERKVQRILVVDDDAHNRFADASNGWEQTRGSSPK